MLKRLKANWRRSTVQAKLLYLKKEWIEGASTKADLVHWENSLSEFKKDIVPYVKGLHDQLNTYEQIYALIQHQVATHEMSRTSVPVLIFAGLEGELSHLRNHIVEQAQSGDRVVVLGDFWVGDKPELDDVRHAMSLALDEGVVFLLGKEEKERLLAHEWPDVEFGFINQLPLSLNTEAFVFFAEAAGDGTVDLDDLLKGDLPNVSGKLFVYRGDDAYPEGLRLNQETSVMALNRGLMMRLDMTSTLEEPEGERKDD